MKTFDSLTEREILALAISLEEEDARIYEDFADGLQDNYPEQAAKFRTMRQEEDGHRHRLLELYKQRFGEHCSRHIRRTDVRGFVERKPSARPAPGPQNRAKNRRKHGGGNAPLLRGGLPPHHGHRHPPTDPGDLAEEERIHAHTAEKIALTELFEDDKSQQQRLVPLSSGATGPGWPHGRLGFHARAPLLCRRVRHAQQLGDISGRPRRQRAARASAWALPRRCPTTVQPDRAAAIRGRAVWCAA